MVLFLLTLLTTTLAGLFYAGAEGSFLDTLLLILIRPGILLKGLPFSFTLVSILLAHELGHYFACRRYGIACTAPFFLPAPFPPPAPGTFGAFIRIRSPFQHKRALFDVGLAGPLAGFLFVLPALTVGIAHSRLVPKIPQDQIAGILSFGEPLIFRWLGRIVLGYAPATQDMLAHPIAIGAWWGVLATSLNLLPIWQLDGGHITYAVFGRERQRQLSIVVAAALVLVSLAGWPVPSYLVFALLLLGLGLRFRFFHPPTLDDHKEIGPARAALAVVALIILVLCFTPVPISFGG